MAQPTDMAKGYQAWVTAQIRGRDPLVMLREAPQTLAQLVNGVPEATVRQPPAPGKWCVAAILAHLAEGELTASWRYRQMLERPGVELSSFDQEEWAKRGEYETWDPRTAIEMFRLLREANLRVLARLTAEDWQRWGVHGERGRTTVAEFTRHIAAHDENHIEQIRQILHAKTAGA